MYHTPASAVPSAVLPRIAKPTESFAKSLYLTEPVAPESLSKKN